MQKLLKNRFFLIAGSIFISILVITAFLIFKFGRGYGEGLENILDDNQNNRQIQLTKKKPIKKIVFKNTDNTGCTEVTPEGIIRVYTDCNKELDQAARLTDPKNILKLIKLVSETDWEKYQIKGVGSYYEIVIEMEGENLTIYLPDDGSAVSDEIIQTITDVQKDIPGASPSPSSAGASFLPSVSVYPSLTPSGWGGWASPLPSASGDAAQQTFTCLFTESGGKKKPVNVSNIICSTDPIPAP